MPRTASKKTVIAFIGLAAVCLLWCLARTLPAYDTVVRPGAEGSIYLVGADPYYHLRHVEFCLEHFPRILRWDPVNQFPHGRMTESSGAYQLGLAAVAFLVGAKSHPERILTVLAWSPVVFGVLLLLATFMAARHLGSSGSGTLAAALLLVFPGQLVVYGTFGFGDYHILESLLALLIYLGLISLLDEPPGHGLGPPAGLKSLPMLLFLFTWPGSALHLLIAIITLATLMLKLLVASRNGDALTHLARQSFRYGVVPLVVYVTVTWCFSSMILFSGNHYPTLLGLFFITFGLPALCLTLREARFPTRGLQKAALAVLLLSAVGGLVLSQTTYVQGAVSFALEPREPLIGEHAQTGPLLWLGMFGVCLILALFGGVKAWRESNPERLSPLALAVPTLLYLLFWWRTLDLGYLPPPFLAVLASFGAYHMTRPKRQPWVHSGIALLVVLQFFSGSLHAPYADPFAVRRGQLMHEGWEQAMTWMRDNTPVFPEDINAIPEWGQSFKDGYGIFTAWDFGHLIVALGRRPVAFSQSLFVEPTRWWISEDEEYFYQELSKNRLRYVVTESRLIAEFFPAKAQTAGRDDGYFRGAVDSVVFDGVPLPLRTYGEAYERTMAVRLHQHGGNHLSHFRLVYESPMESFISYVAEPKVERQQFGLLVDRRSFLIRDPSDRELFEALSNDLGIADSVYGLLYGAALTPAVRIFERVPGAKITGRSAPGDSVKAQILLESRTTGKKFVYEHAVEADSNGDFSLVVPYSTFVTPASAVVASGPYTLTRSGGQCSLSVTEFQVASGTVINLGEF